MGTTTGGQIPESPVISIEYRHMPFVAEFLAEAAEELAKAICENTYMAPEQHRMSVAGYKVALATELLLKWEIKTWDLSRKLEADNMHLFDVHTFGQACLALDLLLQNTPATSS